MLLLNDIRLECHNLTARRPESSPEQPRGGGMKKKEEKKRRVQREIPTFFSRQHSFAVLSRSRHVLPRPSVISVHLVCVCGCVCHCWGSSKEEYKNLNLTLSRVFQSGWLATASLLPMSAVCLLTQNAIIQGSESKRKCTPSSGGSAALHTHTRAYAHCLVLPTPQRRSAVRTLSED